MVVFFCATGELTRTWVWQRSRVQAKSEYTHGETRLTGVPPSGFSEGNLGLLC